MAAFVAAGMLALTGCAGGVNLTACPAIGYLFDGPAVVRFEPVLPAAATVAACFGADCAPAAVAATSDRTWQVPQTPAYLGSGLYGDGSDRTLRVVATDGERGLIDDGVEIPISVERTGIFGQCPGPFRFEPVTVTWKTDGS